MDSILIVDDDYNLCSVLSDELNEIGYKSNFVTTADDAFDFIAFNKVSLLLLDLKMPEKDGFYVLRKIKDDGIKINVIVLTAYADVQSAIESAKLGASDFISKPYDLDELLVSIRKALAKENNEN
ncbi:MAG: response regulator [Bacteroidetes bacterium]|nr:response regulator [Bacteroidota bacterium]MBU1678463.1 response regulator [Bacteroidota bacterium]MBU2505238.1 response regulator [Bacteroidota bacterium]